MTVFTNGGSGLARVPFSAPYAGKILAMDLSTLGGELICQKEAFLCAAKGVSISDWPTGSTRRRHRRAAAGVGRGRCSTISASAT